MIKKLEKLGVNLKNTKKEVEINSKLDQQTFLFTGSLPTLKRSEAEELVEKNGGRLLGSVSSKLNYLVVGEDAGSKLDKAKKISSIKIMNEEEFLKMIKT
jgi:DNA ligase (NAD+)